MRLILAAVLAFALPAALAAPKARHSADCAVIGNMAAVAGVLAKHGMEQTRALELYPDLYSAFFAERPQDAPVLARLAVAAAYANRVERPAVEPYDYGAALVWVCQQLNGDLDQVLGGES